MNFSQRQADPRRHMVGIGFVILFHLFIVYALVTGLAKKVVDVVRAPIETKVIEEIKKPPPPPEIVVPPPPKLEAPPPPFIPPPEVQIATPPPAQPTITSTPVAPPAPVNITPAPAVAAAPAPAPPAPAQPTGTAACPAIFSAMTSGAIPFPREAERLGLERGDAVIEFTIAANGETKDARVLRASHPIFGRASMKTVLSYKCNALGHDVVVTIPFNYKPPE